MDGYGWKVPFLFFTYRINVVNVMPIGDSIKLNVVLESRNLSLIKGKTA